ncbi:MAG: preprotein translocase subunit SecE [Ignisphaera sp.]|uniref:Protein translocase SEC61 complex subunit gamma n=1 Tax=Ignisphaera aggregans TaxID=334771 RepID=A0A7C4D0V5_9CREN
MSRKFTDYFKDMTKILELAEKPEGSEFKQIFKIVMLGFIVVGALSFGIAMAISMLLTVFGVGVSP